MDQAVGAMAPAATELKGAKWDSALAPEQKALQYLLRAEATMRDIQVAFGQRAVAAAAAAAAAPRATAGHAGAAAGFDLELDTEKNQYRTPRSRTWPISSASSSRCKARRAT
jgi:hypothetical protein